jgi:hypothetical protein
MATLGTQNISTSYVQLIKTSGLTGIDPTIQTITDGNNVSSALQLSTAGVNSTGTLNAVGATTLASSLGVTGAVTLSSTLGVTGAATFSSSISATTGTVTIGTATISTATISTATIPTILGAVTFGSNITASTGTATIGTESVNTSTIGTLGVTALATLGSAKIGASGPTITKVSYGTAAFTGSTFQDLDSATAGSNVTTGTFAVTGAALGDIVFGGLTSIGSSTGTNATLAQRLIPSFRVESADTIRYVILNTDTVSHGTTPAGTLFATAMRFTT